MSNATSWPKMIRAVYASFDTGQHHNDAVARRVMDRIVSWLVAGKALSPRLQAKLIDNINMRTRFKVADPIEAIRLTRGQLDHIKRTTSEWFELGLADEDLPAENMLKDDQLSASSLPQDVELQQVFSSLSASIQHSFSVFAALFQHEALALAQRLVSVAAEKCGSGTTCSLGQNPKVMEREEKECNHDMEVISASPSRHDHDCGGAAMDEEVIGQKLTHGHHERHVPQADVHTEQHEHAARQNITDIDGQGERTATSRPTLTLWVKEDAKGKTHATGFLDVGDDKYALRFSRFDHQLERIRDASDAEWVASMSETIAPDLLAIERANSGIAGSATMSGLYARRDTWARKEPVRANTAVILEWRAGEPDAVHMIEGTNQTTIELRREANDRWKGSIAA